MALDEHSRHQLHGRLQEVLGMEEADTLMEHLPPAGWADVATKRDLDQLQLATKHDLDQLQLATKRDLDRLALAHQGLEARMESMKAELIARIDAGKYEVIAVLRGDLNAQARNMMLTMSGLMVTLAGLAFAAARLV